mmetsp:Transcript_7601/g.14257  ORF Transcript_7601/g.14257 Transcript_7601/m.14257 type:complete len:656 (+) Transcript_7601:1184-3151(+)|eukprot:CAMPEP_0204897558 /NCGR_PEP_ID=MMETSP1397-20131031/807_1 /ASSEMBLY_ACC=CAM_ASM_000891 /TAXON_ID=49980 /ORGANISM="Climacostomum Climacostomum virens, Strain Stock W-24" /LENGTH=655 /DNA_ID=CAMNT_0052065325 /DNA_START=1050 /DNA_END=3017 /DNA_ORIENTATION=+
MDEVAVHYYLLLTGHFKTLQTLREERPASGPTTHADWRHKILRAFDSGDREAFVQEWSRYVPEVCKDTEYSKLEFYSQLHFLTQAKGSKERWKSNLLAFKEFLTSAGASLCQTSEFLPFFALPHIPEPFKHPSFQPYFASDWTNDIRRRLERFLERLPSESKNPNSLRERVAELSQQLEKAHEKEEMRRKLLAEQDTKWVMFAVSLLNLSKQLFAHIQGDSNANLNAIAKKMLEYDKFLSPSDDSISNTSIMLPISQKEQLPSLHYPRLKRDLHSSQDELKLTALLQALRHRLTRTLPSVRREILQDYLDVDLLMVDSGGLSKLLGRENRKIAEFAAKLVNVIASKRKGRGYLLQDPDLIPVLTEILKKEALDTCLRQNALGVVQKLSLRKQPQTVMISQGMIPWLVSILNRPSEQSDYTMEYGSALLMNLSLRTEGKNACEKPELDILRLLSSLMDNSNPQVRTYINGTLYSILARPVLKERAKASGLEAQLQRQYNRSDETIRHQIRFILRQLSSEEDEQESSEEEADDESQSVDDSELMSDDECLEESQEESCIIVGEELLRSEYALAEEVKQEQPSPSVPEFRVDAPAGRPEPPPKSAPRSEAPPRPVVTQEQPNPTDLRKQSPKKDTEALYAFAPRNKIPRTPVVLPSKK